MKLAIIQARMNSERLKGKSLMQFNGKSILMHTVDRVRAVNKINEKVIDAICVTTPDMEIVKECEKYGVDSFLGSENNVLDRFYKCAVSYNLSADDEIIRITADCPVIDPVLIYGMAKHECKEYVALDAYNSVPDGYDCEKFKFWVLEEGWVKSEQDEHVTTWIKKNRTTELIKTGLDFKGVKLSVDDRQDFERITEYAKLL